MDMLQILNVFSAVFVDRPKTRIHGDFHMAGDIPRKWPGSINQVAEPSPPELIVMIVKNSILRLMNKYCIINGIYLFMSYRITIGL